LFIHIVSVPSTEFEERLCDTNTTRWADAVSTLGNSVQVTEWKNIPLDYIFVPGGEWNIPNASQDQILIEKKASALRYKNS